MLCRLLTNRVDIFPSSFLTNRVDIFPSSFLTNRVDPLCRGQGSDGSRGIGRQRGRGLFTMPEYTPHWLQWRKGESLSAIRGAKVFAYKDPERLGGPTVFWQIRELAFALGLPAKTSFSKWYRKHGRPSPDELPRFLQTCGCISTDWRPSTRACQHIKTLSPARRQWLREEFSCSTRWAIGLLMLWSQRFQTERRARALSVLEDVMVKGLMKSGTRALERARWAPPQRSRELCACAPPPSAGEADGGTCFHAHHVLEEASLLGQEECGVSVLVKLLGRIAAAETRCALVCEWKTQIIWQVAAKIDDAFLWSRAPPPASVKDMVEEGHGFPSLMGRKRRRRLDRDLLLGRTAKSMRLKRYGSGAKASRSGDIDCSASSAKDGEQEHCVRYMQATEDAFTGQTQVHVAFDESSVGDATMATAIYSHDLQKAAWLLPMVASISL